ncbi:indole-3-glycerol phosphate synthase TrpC [Schinkia azotoformans]|uniref:indole-3-glycerol phosphate synthase TrpC n=1 Tax=Schinkia azotoformans TaxID=1454 RepID=UPI002DB869B3|nr:indole-3-glycerol phosphate synthase TrpC [Schinkia azotoformans]MEC1716729.1 indole-3-glycerol phosphate synthase TrpC [Schinkia azotoformans]MEC1746171.1 indole-3-glycerol phosphate synthase TrpC [Schinkia azotoformans]MEC1756426.1 indole-3-glycerol phosphate synthase TrpC [Schinkia azotoformans]MEC1771709.1 indole-3-glycerol phosphate synthase TrpC [Schinkia azotoformans]MED4366806.1 indole-3-glycerol phosphate synthase TrpC [Schinkia azotoformans]
MLNKIIETKKEEVAQLVLPPKESVKPVSFFNALQNTKNEVALIAEVKKASPSKGIIKENFDPIQIAKEYERGGADAISVLTDSRYFQGKREYIPAIKKAVSLPILRKDFIIDENQVLESKLIGADAILLIAEVLEASKLYEFYQFATELGLDCLVEIHSSEALEGILSIFTPKIIGVNNRNLKTFEVTLEQTETITSYIPEESLFISESGIFTHDDILRVKKAGAKAVLVGESLMRAETPAQGILTLFGAGAAQ